MGKHRKKKIKSTLTWKAAKGIFHLLSEGILKAMPLFIFGAIGFVIFWTIRGNLYADPGFLVQRLEVVPEESFSPEKLQELERLYLKQNLFKISPREVAKTLGQDPQIQNTFVIRKFPATLRIEVKERRPFAQIQFSPQGAYYWIAEDGIILGKDPLRQKSIYLVEVFDTKVTQPKIGRPASLSGFSEAVALTKVFAAHPLARRETLERIRLDDSGNVTLVLTKGPELRFGLNPLKRISALDSLPPLLKGPDRDRLIYIDLQYQDLVVRKK